MCHPTLSSQETRNSFKKQPSCFLSLSIDSRHWNTMEKKKKKRFIYLGLLPSVTPKTDDPSCLLRGKRVKMVVTYEKRETAVCGMSKE